MAIAVSASGSAKTSSGTPTASVVAPFWCPVIAVTARRKPASRLLIFALPLADALIAIGRRLLARDASGQSRVRLVAAVGRVLTGDRAHIHHRLLGLGFSHRGAVLTLYALMILCSAVALLTMDVP